MFVVVGPNRPTWDLFSHPPEDSAPQQASTGIDTIVLYDTSNKHITSKWAMVW
jgi:hypothetical protein